MISYGVAHVDMQPTNCLLCGELDEVGDNVSAFDIAEDISTENARRVCKLLKLPYQDNATVLKGLRTCNFCKDCKNDIVKFDSFVGQLETLKSTVVEVKEVCMAHLQSAQAGSYDVCTDEAALKTAKTRQYLRDCMGIFRTDDEESAEQEPNGFDQAQDDNDDEDEGFCFKILDVRGGTDVDLEFSQDKPQKVEADDGLVLSEVVKDLDGGNIETEVGSSSQDPVSENFDPPPPYTSKAGGSSSRFANHIGDAADTSQDGYDEDLDADDSTDLMDLEHQFLIAPDLSDDEENGSRMDEDPLKIFDDDYESEGMPNGEPEVSRGSSDVEVGYQLPAEWYRQDAGVHFLVQDQMPVMSKNVGRSLLKCNLGRLQAPKTTQNPKMLNWADLVAAVSPSCYKIHVEPNGTKKLKLTGEMTFAEIKQKVAEYREAIGQGSVQGAQGFSGSGSESSFDSTSNSPTEVVQKKGKTRHRGIPHQNNERKRRAELASSFEELRKLVPSLSVRKAVGLKYSKVSILLGATEYCRALKNMEQQQLKELFKLQGKRNELKKKLGFHQLGSIVTNSSITITPRLS